ncbi:hypothetical protein CRG98_035908 [Punica granatum]|uniref:Uncharacterized protein n=1 Tax=Punica granatum TaxID=22663 RepID=A0A2I0II71_PUNGR|nr:hypothetical protein CRG98_035908 [Punica granatum]
MVASSFENLCDKWFENLYNKWCLPDPKFPFCLHLSHEASTVLNPSAIPLNLDPGSTLRPSTQALSPTSDKATSPRSSTSDEVNLDPATSALRVGVLMHRFPFQFEKCLLSPSVLIGARSNHAE